MKVTPAARKYGVPVTITPKVGFVRLELVLQQPHSVRGERDRYDPTSAARDWLWANLGASWIRDHLKDQPHRPNPFHGDGLPGGMVFSDVGGSP